MSIWWNVNRTGIKTLYDMHTKPLGLLRTHKMTLKLQHLPALFPQRDVLGPTCRLAKPLGVATRASRFRHVKVPREGNQGRIWLKRSICETSSQGQKRSTNPCEANLCTNPYKSLHISMLPWASPVVYRPRATPHSSIHSIHSLQKTKSPCDSPGRHAPKKPTSELKQQEPG